MKKRVTVIACFVMVRIGAPGTEPSGICSFLPNHINQQGFYNAHFYAL